MSDARDPQPFGIIFSGPPGFLSVWFVTPDEYLMSREIAETLGLSAVHYGAADYRTFLLEGNWQQAANARSALAHGEASFVRTEELPRLQELLAGCGGLPFESHQPPLEWAGDALNRGDAEDAEGRRDPV